MHGAGLCLQQQRLRRLRRRRPGVLRVPWLQRRGVLRLHGQHEAGLHVRRGERGLRLRQSRVRGQPKLRRQRGARRGVLRRIQHVVLHCSQHILRGTERLRIVRRPRTAVLPAEQQRLRGRPRVHERHLPIGDQQATSKRRGQSQ